MQKDDLAKRILKSDAYVSLFQEQRVARIVKKLDWSVNHGYYYRDTKTDKVREIDVIATKWWRKPLKRGDQSVSLKLIVESKSAKDFHLVTIPFTRKIMPLRTPSIWFGAEKNYIRVFSELVRSSLGPDQITTILNNLKGWAYPRGESLFGRLGRVLPPPSKFNTSAFRETNIGNQKSLDQSVMWKGGQALRSAFLMFSKERLEYHFSWVLSALDSPFEGEDPVEEVLNWLYEHIRMLDFYHPVLVIDSHLWMQNNKRIEEIPWFRFLRVDSSQSVDWWFDVVNVEHFEKYASDLTKCYEKDFRKRKAILESAAEKGGWVAGSPPEKHR